MALAATYGLKPVLAFDEPRLEEMLEQVFETDTLVSEDGEYNSLAGFLLRASRLGMKSTARYIGRLETSGQLLDDVEQRRDDRQAQFDLNAFHRAPALP